jgi:tight adherence protein C
MSIDPTLLLALSISIACVVAGLILLPIAERDAHAKRRVASVRDGTAYYDPPAGEQLAAWMRPLGILGSAVLSTGLLSRKTVEDLGQTMSAAGYRSGPAVSLFIGAKIAGLIGLPMLMLLLIKLGGIHALNPPLVMLVFAVVGLLLPDFVVRSVRRKYVKAVENGLPAALDLLIICAEAGLALEAGFERVALEFEEGIRPTANELRITANEMKVLSDRRQALLNMGTRTGLESMQRLGGMLAQSQKYGTPLTQALRVLAAEMRTTMLTRFEARAARLPVLLTIPMILFILPCIFVVVAGPAAIQVMHIMRTR